MIQEIEFKNFRGLKHLTLNELKRITLISGKNNAGKSSVLDGIFLFFDHMATESFLKLSAFRGMNTAANIFSLWESLFYNLNLDNQLEISMTRDGIDSKLTYEKDDSYFPIEQGNIPPDLYNQIFSSAKNTYTLKFNFEQEDYREEGHFATGSTGIVRNIQTNKKNNNIVTMPFVQMINSKIIYDDNVVVNWFGKIELEGRKDEIVKVLQLLDPMICDISTISLNGVTQLYVKREEKLLQIKLAGDGLNKLLFIVLAIMGNPNSVILIDEIETGFHYSMYEKLWEVISDVALTSNCQVIATTHSYECIESAISGIKEENKKEFCYFRIAKNEENNSAYRYSDELLHTAVLAEMEVR